MKQIKAFVRPEREDQVVDAIEALTDPPGLSVETVYGWGHPKEGTHHKLTEQIKFEIMVPDDELSHVMSQIRESATSGHYGDGKIFVMDLDEALRIRDNKSGPEIV
ncbi:MAG: P-II family nitrogen regulator [bacterium]